jgi:hypothetical protein
MQEFSKRYETSDRVIYIGLAQIPSRYYFRDHIEKEGKYTDFSDIRTDEFGDEHRLWVIVRKKTGKPLTDFLAKMKETHRVLYAIISGRAPVYLLERVAQPG